MGYRWAVGRGGGFGGLDAVENSSAVEWSADEFFRGFRVETTVGGGGRASSVIKIVVVGIGESVVVIASRVAVGVGGGAGRGGEGEARGKLARGEDRGGVERAAVVTTREGNGRRLGRMSWRGTV